MKCVRCGWRHVYESGDVCGVCQEGVDLAAKAGEDE